VRQQRNAREGKMNDKTNQDHPEDRDDETIERLLRLAGPRAPIPEDIEARVYDRVHREWRAASQQPDGARVYHFVRHEWEKDTAKRRYLRWALPAALAASVVIAVTLFMQPPTSAPDRIVIGAAGVRRERRIQAGLGPYVCRYR
jgi:hypothetical protein